MFRLGEMSDDGQRGASVPGDAAAPQQQHIGRSHITVRANPQRPKVRAVPEGRKRLKVGTKPAYLTRIYAPFQLDRLNLPIINCTWPMLSHRNVAFTFTIRFNSHGNELVNPPWLFIHSFLLLLSVFSPKCCSSLIYKDLHSMMIKSFWGSTAIPTTQQTR